MKKISTLLLLFAVALGCAQSAPAAPTITHVVLIMEENHSYSQAMAGMPYLKSMATAGDTETSYDANHFPSLPNYIEITSGVVPPALSGKDCTPSSSCSSPNQSIFGQVSWKVWASSMPKPCDKSNAGEYAVRHTAGPYYTKLTNCTANDVALPSTSTVSAAFTFVAPNLLQDAHDGTLAQANTWLAGFVPKLESQASYKSGNMLIEVTFDSGAGNCGANCKSQVALVAVAAGLGHHSVSIKANHCSLLRLNEELLGQSLLGCAASAPDLRSAFGL